jgi:catechol 2,3-dioxygenase
LGFEVMMNIGAEAAFLSAGGYHHHIGGLTSVRVTL